MSFIVVFLVTLLVIVGLVTAMVVGRTPTYRPTRAEILALMRDVEEGKASTDRWNLFLGMPVLHDPPLETLRQRCVVVDEGGDEQPASRSGLNIYDRNGRERIGKIADELERLIAKEPVYREF